MGVVIRAAHLFPNEEQRRENMSRGPALHAEAVKLSRRILSRHHANKRRAAKI